MAIGYIRVSTDDQALGPEAQRAAILAWAARQGVEIASVHVDHGVSGATPLDRRPGLLAALGQLHARGAGVLVAAKRDRFARDVVVAATVERAAMLAGAVVRTADGSSDAPGPEGDLMRAIVDAFAAYERAMIRARTRSALAVKRARGERTGTLPYGFRVAADGVRLDADPDEQAVIALILDLRAEGRSLRGIAAELEARGIRARSGRPLAKTQVERILGRAVEGAAAARAKAAG